jgi:divalent metal cation (Fe/Co/Zn/Cd) transporter
VIAIILGMETSSLLVGEGATERENAAIVAAIQDASDAPRIIHMKTLYLGPDEMLVAAKLGFAGDKPLAEVASDIDLIEARVRAAVPTARVLYFEPDIYRPGQGQLQTDAIVIKSVD